MHHSTSSMTMNPGQVNPRKSATARLLPRRPSLNSNNNVGNVFDAPKGTSIPGAGLRFSDRKKSLQAYTGLVGRWAKRPYALSVVALVVLCFPHYVLFTMKSASRATTSLEPKGQALRGPIQDKEFLPVDTPAGPPRSVSLEVPGKKPKTSPKIDKVRRKELTTKEDDGDVLPPVCTRSPLWEKSVEATEYHFGCQEIEEIILGEKTLIGNGNIRDVYLAEYKGQQLVVKVLRDDFEERASKTRVDNIHRWEAAAIDAVKGHPNVVGLLGMCGSTSVSQYFPERLDNLVLNPEAERLPIARVLSMSLDAARGLQALHEAPGGAIVHFDLKPQQMMLDDRGTLKINDLNMCWFTSLDAAGNSCLLESRASRPGPGSRHIHPDFLTTHCRALLGTFKPSSSSAKSLPSIHVASNILNRFAWILPIIHVALFLHALVDPTRCSGPWRSPENIAGEDLTEKVDVYSLAMVFYSMLAGKPPFEGEESAQHKILTGIPPATDPSWHPGFLEVIRDMWRRDPSARPSAKQVAERLEVLVNSMTA